MRDWMFVARRCPVMSLRSALIVMTLMDFAPAMSAPASAAPLDQCAGITDPSAQAPIETVTVVQVTGPNAFVTSSGLEVRLASISTPHRFRLPMSQTAEASAAMQNAAGEIADDPGEQGQADDVAFDLIDAARSALVAWLVGQEVRLYPVTPEPDRYGRQRARVVRVSDGLWIEAEAVARGLARVEPRTDDYGCARQLQSIEGTARAAALGLWALPEFALVAADDVSRDRWIGRYVLIEGTVVSLGTSGTRRYLNFGRNFSRDFAVVLVDKGAVGQRTSAKRPVSRFHADGFDLPGVVGKRIRVRGILTKGGGGLIVPTVPEEIEWVEDRR